MHAGPDGVRLARRDELGEVTQRDAGMTLAELVALGVEEALNLNGGGSASLVFGGRLRNRPREEHGVGLLEGRPILSAIVFEPRTRL